jgi:hypothetical protein
MAFHEEWLPAGPPLTLDTLYVQGGPDCFLYRDTLYVGLLVEQDPQRGERRYLSTARGASVMTPFAGFTVVTPMVGVSATPLSSPSPAPR